MCLFLVCPEYIIPDEELYDGPNNPTIHFGVYNYQGICATYGIIPNELTLCKLCDKNYDINNGPIKSKKYRKNKHLTKMSFSIGEFHKAYYQPMLKKYAYHMMLLFLLVNYESKELRREYYLTKIMLLR